MKSIILTLFYTKRGLNLLDEEFEDDLFRKSIFIFCIYGIVKFIVDFDEQNNEVGFFLNLFDLIMTVLFSVIMGMLFSYILYKIGKWIKGKSNYIEIFSLYAYSFFPIIIGALTIGVLERTNYLNWNNENFNFKNLILLISFGLSIKILFQGLLKFNKYGIKKAVLNLSILIGLIIGLIFLLPHLIIN